MTVDLELLPKSVSYSQVNSWLSCGKQYELERVYKIPRRPAWWFIGGSVFHKMTELWDLARADRRDEWEVEENLREIAYQLIEEEVKKALEDTDYKLEDIQAREDGRASADFKVRYPNGEDFSYWMDQLPILVSKYIHWRKVNRWGLWDIPEFGPAIEYPLSTLVDGYEVRGYLDRVFVTGGSQDVLVDMKSGASQPSSFRQLGYMAEMLERQTGIDVRFGAYYNARSKPDKLLTQTVDLSRWRANFDTDVTMFRRGVEAGVFLPNESNRCGSCGVKDWCPIKGTQQPVLEAHDGGK